jgi:hypothetical protein
MRSTDGQSNHECLSHVTAGTDSGTRILFQCTIETEKPCDIEIHIPCSWKPSLALLMWPWYRCKAPPGFSLGYLCMYAWAALCYVTYDHWGYSHSVTLSVAVKPFRVMVIQNQLLNKSWVEETCAPLCCLWWEVGGGVGLLWVWVLLFSPVITFNVGNSTRQHHS